MREIKFRAWGVDGESPIKMWSWEYIREDFDIWLDDKKAVIMQYTGIKDIKGREIYEGDIVKWCDGFGSHIEVVSWHEKGAVSWTTVSEGSHQFLIAKAKYEVIGNIYENPELVSQNKNE